MVTISTTQSGLYQDVYEGIIVTPTGALLGLSALSALAGGYSIMVAGLVEGALYGIRAKSTAAYPLQIF